jgi:hypothetical protein
VPILYPGLVVSVATLIIVSLLTPPPTPEELKGLLPERTTA